MPFPLPAEAAISGYDFFPLISSQVAGLPSGISSHLFNGHREFRFNLNYAIMVFLISFLQSECFNCSVVAALDAMGIDYAFCFHLTRSLHAEII